MRIVIPIDKIHQLRVYGIGKDGKPYHFYPYQVVEALGLQHPLQPGWTSKVYATESQFALALAYAKAIQNDRFRDKRPLWQQSELPFRPA